MFVIFRNSNDYLKAIFDGYHNKEVIIDKDFKSMFLTIIKNYHTSIRLNKKYHITFKGIWFPFYLDYRKINKNEEVYFIFFEGARMAYQKKYLEYLKKRYVNSKFIFRFVNPVNMTNRWMLDFVDKNYDMVVSMDQADCHKYNWTYVYNTYNIHLKKIYNNLDIDVFFVGSEKGRLGLLIDICKFLISKGLNCVFFVANVNSSNKSNQYQGIKYIKSMRYSETIEYIKRSKCLLEIVQNGQNGSTLRPIEALVYGKKLLTNDKNILTQDFYDKNNMFYFDKIEEIDVRFITESVIENRQALNKISHEVLFEKIKMYFK